LSELLQVMRLRRAFLQIPAKSSVPLGLRLDKNRSLLTRSKSTLPQPLIPLDFISFRTNVYKKPGGGAPRLSPKDLQLVTSPSLFLRARSNVHNPIPLMHLLHKSPTGRGGVSLRWDSQSWLSLLPACLGTRRPKRGTRATTPLVPRYRCGATRKVPESRQLLMAAPPPGNISAPGGV
jgi:hypothetical protein